MRQRADGNPVHARLGEFSHVGERDSSGCLGANLFARGSCARTCSTACRTSVGLMLSSRIDVGLVCERLAQFVQVRDFDFDPCRAALGRLRGRERRADASRQANMIFLDQDGFAEIFAMILASAHADRIFFERAQAGRGFSRIQDCVRPCLRWRAQSAV